MTIPVVGIPPLSVQSFLDREKGKPAWLLGGGPSLLQQDPQEVDGCVIAINFSIWAQERLGTPQAKYWLFCDLPVMWRPGFPVVDPDGYPETHKFVNGAPLYYLLGRGYEPSESGLGKTFFPVWYSDNHMVSRRSDYLWTHQSTLNAALSLAWVLGCNPIHIRGCDFGLKHGDGRLHWYDPPGSNPDPVVKPEQYDRMKQPIRFLVNAIRSQGIEITAGGDTSILEPEAV